MVKVRRAGCLCSMHSILVIAIIIWTTVFAYLSISLYNLQSKGKDVNEKQALISNYEQALLDLAGLKDENEKLRGLLNEEKMLKSQERNISANKSSKFKKWQRWIAEEKNKPSNIPLVQDRFSTEHEMARRQLHTSIWELYYYLSNQLELASNISAFKNHARNQMLSLLGQSAAFRNTDSAESWRANALANISAIFQNHFYKMQNPDDCKAARILTCDLNKQCGFGCQLHHVTYCFIVAYGSNRTLVLRDDGRTWNYAPDGWNSAFLPITKCSFSEIFKPNENADSWSTDKHYRNKRILNLPIVDSLSYRPPYLPLAIPQSYSGELLKLHSNPPVFFISQFIRYLMRPSAVFAEKIDDAARKVPYDKGPIVGLQIRRTDKIHTEASFHDLDEYMKWTEDWFQIEEYRIGSFVKRRIYIATDDPKVFNEAATKYPNYEIYGDVKISSIAQVQSRYTMESLIGVVVDIELLSRCTFLVCTFSSQVCRMGYELMQIHFGDAGDRFHSLDDIYYFGGQQAHEQVVVEPYVAENDDEIDLKTGDVIGIAGNHWNGFSKGTNRRTGQNGLYPSYKTREKYIILDFP
uniref:Alpha-(1,6)-fucosyltransferase n=1 Tax=Setaria digitata TaxID=48799 RepID=A0A915PI45_9BILA